MSKEINIEKEDLKGVLDTVERSLTMSISDKNKAIFGDWLPKMVEHYDFLNIRDVGNFTLTMNLQMNPLKYDWIEYALFELGITNKHKNYHKLVDLYDNYTHMKNHIIAVFEKYEGRSCCVDKTRWLLEAYKSYLLDGVMPEKDTREEYSFTQTSEGNIEDWINFIDSIPSLINGTGFNQYAQLRMTLDKAYRDALTK